MLIRPASNKMVISGAYISWYFLYNDLNRLKISNKYHANIYTFVIGFVKRHSIQDRKKCMHCFMMKSGAQVGLWYITVSFIFVFNHFKVKKTLTCYCLFPRYKRVYLFNRVLQTGTKTFIPTPSNSCEEISACVGRMNTCLVGYHYTLCIREC